MRIKIEKYAALLFLVLMQSASTSCGAENILGDVIKDVAGATSKVVKEVARGAETVVVDTGKVVKGTAKVGEVIVVDTAKGAGSLVKGVAHGAGGLVEATGKAVAHVGEGKADAANSAKGQVAPWSASTLIGTTCSVTVDGAGNIIDSSGHLLGRVIASQTAPESGSVALAGQTLSVSISASGEMREPGGRVIGYLLGAAESTKQNSPAQNASSAKDEASKDSDLGVLHGFLPENK